MKTVILAGGLGTRLSEETSLKPKPMVDIGGMPMLWHIMKIYSSHGFKDFIICCGYKGEVIKEYFSNFFLHSADVTIDLKNNQMNFHQDRAEPWKVTLVDTGKETQTGGRIKRVKEYIGNEPFMLTYGDGVSDVNIKEVVHHHQTQGKLATVTAVLPPGRFGILDIDQSNQVNSFLEKPVEGNSYINGGFFVLEPKVIDYIEDDPTIWEREPMELLAKEGQLSAYKHSGFWRCMDTLRDKRQLEEMWLNDKAPWKVWS